MRNVQAADTLRKRRTLAYYYRNWPLHLMLLPCVLLVLLFNYLPMVGISLAFQNYNPVKGFFGSDYAGLKHFRMLFGLPDFSRVVWNTLKIATLKIVCSMSLSILFALLLNEMRTRRLKNVIHSVALFPHFVSWVIIATMIKDLFYTDGAVDNMLMWLGVIKEPIFFLGDSGHFFRLLIFTDAWKSFGYGSVLITAALTGIDPTLYEAAYIDGANRWKQTLHITLPGISGIIVMLLFLNIGGILNAGFDQIYNLYNNLVMDVADIIDTYVYRMGLVQAQYSLATAAGLFKSAVSFVLLVVSYSLAYKYTDYRIF